MVKYPNEHKNTNKFQKKRQPGHFIDIVSQDKLGETLGLDGLHIMDVDRKDNVVYIYAQAEDEDAVCPYCNMRSSRVHSRYYRTIADLPISGQPARIIFAARKFFCDNEECHHKTFAEQPGREIFRYRRRSCRCERMVTREALSLSSHNASRNLGHYGIHVSSSTILRDLGRLHVDSYAGCRHIGVDDWAMRKGVTYGSVVIDLDNHRPIDLLGDREEDSFREWLQDHRHVELVSRDRSTDYSSAIKSTGAPIVEIADKFHLIKNMSDRLTRLISENYGDYRNAVLRKTMSDASAVQNEESTDAAEDNSLADMGDTAKKPDLRQTMFNEVKQLQAMGFKRTTIAKKLGIARQTATKYYAMDTLPARKSKERNEYYKFDKYVEERYCSGATLLDAFHEITEQGFKGTLSPFYTHYKYLSDGHRGRRRKEPKNQKKEKPVDTRSQLMSVPQISAVAARHVMHKQKPEDQEAMEILKSCECFREMLEAAEEFYLIITGTEHVALIRWMKKYWHTKLRTLKTFIIGIKLDFRAVVNTIKYDTTNGIVEGFVNKIKTLKRMMYGRANISLLRRKLVLEHVFFN